MVDPGTARMRKAACDASQISTAFTPHLPNSGQVIVAMVDTHCVHVTAMLMVENIRIYGGII